MKDPTAEKMMELTKARIKDEAFQRKHTMNPERDFTRQRKLGFPETMGYVLGNCRESMEMNAEKFVEEAQLGSISTAALCKARGKIRWEAFREVFEECAALCPVRKLYQGYELLAVDGMKGEMPNLPNLKEMYPVNSRQSYPMFHAVSVYDPLNEVFLAAIFRAAPADEREMALELSDHENVKKRKAIWLFDRGFPSVALIQKLERMGVYFVMRVSSDFLREIETFADSGLVDKLLNIEWSEERQKGNKTKADLPYSFQIRCVRIHLESGEDEFLITNLPRKEFPKRKIKKLYNFRWGIETSHNYLKNAVFIEEFTSRKENGIKQDFYASLWAANLTSAAIADAMPDTVKKTLKYKANRRNAVKRVYRRLFALFFSRVDRCHRIWNSIRDLIKKSLSAVRPGRRFSRAPNSASHSCVHARACLS